MACIYRLIFPNNKSYIGFSKHDDPKARYDSHRRTSLGKSSSNCKLANALKKYGFDSLDKEILEINEDENYTLKVLEDSYIQKFDSIKNGYNTLKGGGQGPSKKGALNPSYKRKGRAMKEWFTKEQIETHKNSMSERHSGINNIHARKFKICDPSGNSYIVHGNLTKFCDDHKISFLYHYLDKSPIPEISTKARFRNNEELQKRLNAVGWTISRFD